MVESHFEEETIYVEARRDSSRLQAISSAKSFNQLFAPVWNSVFTNAHGEP